MATNTKTKDNPEPAAQTEAAQPAPAAQLPAMMQLRLPYPKSMKEWMGYDERDWHVLTDVIFPLATTAGAIVLAVEYCRTRKLDIMKKVIHIVPMRRKIPNTDPARYEMVDTIWPGIAEVRITATRTGLYAGKDAAVFGPVLKETFQHVDDRNNEVKKKEDVEFPEWCQLTVYKMIQGQRCAFVGPKVYWKEAYATESFYSDIPNDMWRSRKNGQLEKCAEAAALRSAFPEELGGEYTAEEMQGRVLDTNQVAPGHYETKGETLTPPRPKESDFARKSEPKPAANATQKTQERQPAAGSGPDGRPEPPAIGEAIQRDPLPQGPAAQPGPGEGVMSGDRKEPQPAAAQVQEAAREREPEDDVPPSEAYMGAHTLMEEVAPNMASISDLDVFKKEGRANIDKLEGVTDDERDMLRGQFTTMVLTEQQRRTKKGKR